MPCNPSDHHRHLATTCADSTHQAPKNHDQAP
jgi:hypothetical protein